MGYNNNSHKSKINNSSLISTEKLETDAVLFENKLRRLTASLTLFICLALWLSQNLYVIKYSWNNSPAFYLSCFNSFIISMGIILAFSKIWLIVRSTESKRLSDFCCEESNHRKFIEHSTEAFFLLNRVSNELYEDRLFFIEANRSGCNFLKKNEACIIGKDVSDLLPPSILEKFNSVIHKAFQDVKNYEFEFSSDDLGLCPGWFRFSVMPLNDKVAVSVRDITDRKTAETTLRESEAMFRALAETSASMIFILSDDRRFLYTNPSFQFVSGYSEAELFLMQYEEIIHSEQKSKSVHIEEVLQCLPKSPYRDIIKIVAKDGSEKWMDISVTYINIDSTPALLCSALDITERKLAEEEIKESEVRFRTIFDFFPYAISLTEIESGQFISANNQFSRMVKFRNDEIIGKTSAELGIYPDDFRNQYLVSKLREVGFVNNLEIDFRANDGSVFNGSLFSKIIRIKNTEMIISVIKDITDLKTLQRQLQQTQKMEAIGTLAGGIAHDFNNILVPIMAYAEMTMGCVDKSTKQYDYLNNILNASYRAKDLVQQILSFSRQNEMVFEPIIIQPIIKETVKFLRASIPSTIEIKINLDKKCGAIIGNPSQIHQIIMNLSTNAKHAMEKDGGILDISLVETEILPNDFNEFSDLYPGCYAKLSVSDTGHGIENSVLDKIFEPYFTTKNDGKGTGMGLSVVHGIVKTYGGSISVSSLPGAGTKFDIYLPLVHRAVLKEELQISKKKPAGIEHVLLVDDESIIVETEREILEGLGYRVSTMTSSIEAYEFFVKNSDKIDLVITDMTMPKMTGAELAMKILDKKPSTPIILCTGYSENFTESNAAAIGIKKYIVKPFAMHKLACSIREVLDS